MISVIIAAQNEEQNLPALFKPLDGIDDIHLTDHLSTDKTAEIARSLGAHVETRDNFFDEVTEQDEKDWEKRYQFSPHFHPGDKFADGERDVNHLINQTKYDWVLWLDADEVVTWDRGEIEKLLPDHDVVACNFNHSHFPDGKPKDVYPVTKLFRKSKMWFQGKIHGAIEGLDFRVTQTNHMQIDHWQKENPRRATYLPHLEYAYLKERNLRSCYYLAREYFIHQTYERAIQFFDIYLKTAWYKVEKSRVHNYLAVSHWRLGNEEEAILNCFQAIRTNPNSRDPYMTMADFSRPKDAIVWRRLASFIDPTQYI